jgi:DNA-directed RNA polymerase sigma subunit (sigma70/sigma32)
VKNKPRDFNAVWGDFRAHRLLAAHAKANGYEFQDKDEETEWKMRSVFSAVRTFDRTKAAFNTHLWNKAGFEWVEMQREKGKRAERRIRPSDRVSDPRRQERIRDVQELLSLLDKQEADVLLGWYGNDKSYEEIGQPYGWNKRQMKYRVEKAMQKVRALCRERGLAWEDFF